MVHTIEPPAEPPRRWPVRTLGLLLLIQCTSYLTYILYRVRRVDWALEEELLGRALTRPALDAVTVTVTLGPLALVALLTALLLFVNFRAGWLLAMILQAIALSVALAFYLSDEPWFVFPMMLGSVVLVSYLNSYEIRSALAPPTMVDDRAVVDG